MLTATTGWTQTTDQETVLRQLLAARSGGEFDQRLPAAIPAGATRQTPSGAEEFLGLKPLLAQVDQLAKHSNATRGFEC